jgi:hypothetical protein
VRYVGNQTYNACDPHGDAKIKDVPGVKEPVIVTGGDQDPFPSKPHGHIGSQHSSQKINLDTGEIFDGTRPTGKFISKEALEKIKNDPRVQKIYKRLGTACVAFVLLTGTVQAANENGVTGVVDFSVNEVTSVIEGTIIAGATGSVVIGGTAVAGGTMTVGGTTIVSGGTIATGVGAGTVIGVGGAVVVAGAGGYAIGTAIANTKPGRWATTGVGEGMAWVCPWCFRW